MFDLDIYSYIALQPSNLSSYFLNDKGFYGILKSSLEGNSININYFY